MGSDRPAQVISGSHLVEEQLQKCKSKGPVIAATPIQDNGQEKCRDTEAGIEPHHLRDAQPMKLKYGKTMTNESNPIRYPGDPVKLLVPKVNMELFFHNDFNLLISNLPDSIVTIRKSGHDQMDIMDSVNHAVHLPSGLPPPRYSKVFLLATCRMG